MNIKRMSTKIMQIEVLAYNSNTNRVLECIQLF